MFPVPWVHLLVVKPQDQWVLWDCIMLCSRHIEGDIFIMMSKWVVLWSWRYYMACCPIWDHLCFVALFFYCMNISFCFHKTIKLAHSCLAKCHDSSSNNRQVFWWLLRKWCMLLDHTGVLTKGKLVWFSKGSTLKGWRPELEQYSSGDGHQSPEMPPGTIFDLLGAPYNNFLGLSAPLWLPPSSMDGSVIWLRRSYSHTAPPWGQWLL